jgi:hypothetical protein
MFGKMRNLLAIALLLWFCGCTSEEQRFRRDMQQRYEAACDHYFAMYASGDRDSAKRALGQAIDLSLSEQRKAKHYWRFNLIVAYSQARLAVIAESEGKRDEADRLFASASQYMVLQNRAFNEECLRTHVKAAEYSDDEARFTPDRWRKNVAAMDAKDNVKWRQPNPQAGANGRQPFGSDTNQTSTAAASRRSP